MIQNRNRYQLQLEGFVQGVGFRPFVYRLAQSLSLKGWVKNTGDGVLIELECSEEVLKQFIDLLKKNKPSLAKIKKINCIKINYKEANKEASKKDYNDDFNEGHQTTGAPLNSSSSSEGFQSFEIHESDIHESDIHESSLEAKLKKKHRSLVLPDIATCAECLKEIMDPSNRRYQYLFTNCTECGPRTSIMIQLPYDRQNTTMKEFRFCENCLSEYTNPMDRRFHAEPNACPQCGPQISICKEESRVLEIGFLALEKTVEALNSGLIVAIKGLSGYHLAVDAENTDSIKKLRERKRRKKKPFAVMMPNLEWVRTYCFLSEFEEQALLSNAAPIVLLNRKNSSMDKVSNLVAPNNPCLGVFLPHTPLQHWLMKLWNKPLVLTSANCSEDPLVYTEVDLFVRLNNVADYYLVHNRPIVRPMDDSIIQFVDNKKLTLRMGRGLAPYFFSMESPEVLLGVGSHMKNSFSLMNGEYIVLSQQLGDMDGHLAQELFESEVDHSIQFYQLEIEKIVQDNHPVYFSTEWAKEFSIKNKIPSVSIQHHRAHIFASLAETKHPTPFLGVSWDGTGLGDDGTIWGSEFFLPDLNCKEYLKRVGHWRPFILLGGESSIKNPWKVALSLLFEVDYSLARDWFKQVHFDKDMGVFDLMFKTWVSQLNSWPCCSAGRIWDGISALLGLCQNADFEAEAAILLEFEAKKGIEKLTIENKISNEVLSLKNHSPKQISWKKEKSYFQWDWRPWVKGAVEATMAENFNASVWAYHFHQLCTHSIFEMASILGQQNLVLGGGVFQNRLLMSNLIEYADKNQYNLYFPSQVPMNDSGLSFGQTYGACIMSSAKKRV